MKTRSNAVLRDHRISNIEFTSLKRNTFFSETSNIYIRIYKYRRDILEIKSSFQVYFWRYRIGFYDIDRWMYVSE